jgi:hypothetical protein
MLSGSAKCGGAAVEHSMIRSAIKPQQQMPDADCFGGRPDDAAVALRSAPEDDTGMGALAADAGARHSRFVGIGQLFCPKMVGRCWRRLPA